MSFYIAYFLTLLSVVTDSCTGQWWSTEQCWDHWREWSLYWLKTLEGNGKKMLIIAWNHFTRLFWFSSWTLTHHLSLLTSPRPLWLSPAQVMVIPVGGNSESYGKQVSLSDEDFLMAHQPTKCIFFLTFFFLLLMCSLMWEAQHSTDTSLKEVPLFF